VPARPKLIGEYLAELGEGYTRASLRRKAAGIARAYRVAGHALETRHTSIRDVLRGIGRTHGDPPTRAQALATEEIQQLVAAYEDDLAGLRDRALLLIGFAGVLRRSALYRIDINYLSWKPCSVELLIPRSKTDCAAHNAPRVPSGPGTCARARLPAAAPAPPRSAARDIQHTAGSCRMTAYEDSRGVVDPELKVRGAEGPRVADASTIPTDCRANLYFTCVMIGEASARRMRG
jgi:choline dehydrogenase-like flavoprotein